MPITSQFQLEPLIIQSINDLNLTGLKTVGDESLVAGHNNIASLLPAAIVFTGQGLYSNGTDGKLQTEEQFWQVSVIVPHFKQAGTTTAAEAGKYLHPIAEALVGKVLSSDFKPLEISTRPQGNYEMGYAEFPLILKTSFDIQGV